MNTNPDDPLCARHDVGACHVDLRKLETGKAYIVETLPGCVKGPFFLERTYMKDMETHGIFRYGFETCDAPLKGLKLEPYSGEIIVRNNNSHIEYCCAPKVVPQVTWPSRLVARIKLIKGDTEMLVYTEPDEIDDVFAQLVKGLYHAMDYSVAMLATSHAWFGSRYAEDYPVSMDVALSYPHWIERMTQFSQGRTNVDTVAIYDVDDCPNSGKRQLQHYVVLYCTQGSPRFPKPQWPVEAVGTS